VTSFVVLVAFGKLVKENLPNADSRPWNAAGETYERLKQQYQTF
jgi:hypothetical protein